MDRYGITGQITADELHELLGKFVEIENTFWAKKEYLRFDKVSIKLAENLLDNVPNCNNMFREQSTSKFIGLLERMAADASSLRLGGYITWSTSIVERISFDCIHLAYEAKRESFAEEAGELFLWMKKFFSPRVFPNEIKKTSIDGKDWWILWWD